MTTTSEVAPSQSSRCCAIPVLLGDHVPDRPPGLTFGCSAVPAHRHPLRPLTWVEREACVRRQASVPRSPAMSGLAEGGERPGIGGSGDSRRSACPSRRPERAGASRLDGLQLLASGGAWSVRLGFEGWRVISCRQPRVGGRASDPGVGARPEGAITSLRHGVRPLFPWRSALAQVRAERGRRGAGRALMRSSPWARRPGSRARSR
jgi:hypothetical protein